MTKHEFAEMITDACEEWDSFYETYSNLDLEIVDAERVNNCWVAKRLLCYDCDIEFCADDHCNCNKEVCHA